MKRAKVSEAVQLLGGVKTAAEEYYASTGYFPSDVTELTDKFGGKYTEGMTFTGGGLPSNSSSIHFVVSIKFKEEDSVLKDYVFAMCFIRPPAPGQWYCDTVNCPENTMPLKYRPSTCK